MIGRCFGSLLLIPFLSLTPATSEALTGRVENPTGEPVAEAGIDWLDVEGEVGASTTTDTEGHFELEAPPGSRLRVSAAGFLTKELAAEQDPLVIRLVRAAALRLLVTDPEERPVPEAKVRLLEHEADEDAEPVREAVSNEGGRATLDRLTPGLYDVEIRADGFSEQRLSEVTLHPPETHRRVSLRPSLIVTGRVLDPNGEPVPTARVSLLARRPREGEQEPYVGSVADAWHEVDEGGQFRLVLDEGWPTFDPNPAVVARVSGWAPALGMYRPDKSTRRAEGDLVLGEPARVSGRIVDGEGQALPGMALRAKLSVTIPSIPPDSIDERYRRKNLDLLSLLGFEEGDGPRSGEDGRFALTGVPTGRLALTVYEENRPFDWILEGEEVESGAALSDLELVWKRGRSLQGRVLAETGDPLEGAEVAPLQSAGPRTRAAATAQTDAEGRFRLTGLEGDAVERLKVRASGYGTKIVRDLPLDGEPVEIRLLPSGSLSGLVLDARTGEPVQAFAVKLEPIRLGDRLLGERRVETLSSAEGTLRLDDVTPGTYTVKIWSAEHLPMQLDEIEVRIAEETPLAPVHLEPGRQIRGVVLDAATSEPVEGARVYTGRLAGLNFRDPLNTPLVQTGPDGSFHLRGLQGDRVHLLVSHDAYVRHQESVAFEEGQRMAEREVHLGRGGTVAVTVLDREGEPAPYEGIFIAAKGTLERGAFREARTGPDGSATLDRVAPGTYVVGHLESAARSEVEVAEGEITEVALEPEGAMVYGEVTLAGAPFEGARVTANGVLGEKGGAWRFGRPDSFNLKADVRGHRYEVGPIPAGVEVHINAWAREGDPADPSRTTQRQWTGSLQIPEGSERVRQDIEFPDRIVRGRLIRDDTGEGVERAYLTLSTPSGEIAAGFIPTRKDGHFQITGADPGRYRVSGSSTELPGFSVEKQWITVPEEGEVDGIVVRMTRGRRLRGIVVDPEGRPVPGARVQFLISPWPLEFFIVRTPGAFQVEVDPEWATEGSGGITDSAGEFHLTGLEPGKGVLHVAHGDYAPSFPTVEVGDEPAYREVVLTRGGALRIRPNWSDPLKAKVDLSTPGIPRPIRVWRRGPTNRRFAEATDTGELLIPHTPAGTWTVEVREEGKIRRAVVEVEEGGESEVEL